MCLFCITKLPPYYQTFRDCRSLVNPLPYTGT